MEHAINLDLSDATTGNTKNINRINVKDTIDLNVKRPTHLNMKGNPIDAKDAIHLNMEINRRTANNASVESAIKIDTSDFQHIARTTRRLPHGRFPLHTGSA